MLQRTFSLFFCGILLISCEFFQKKKLSKDFTIDTIINFKSVDVFPLFPDCDSVFSQKKQRICSQIKLSEHIYSSLSSFKITTTKKINDTIYVELLINKKGKVLLTNIVASEFINNQIPKLDSLLKAGVLNLPKLKPAIKRGIPVSTALSLPIIIEN